MKFTAQQIADFIQGTVEGDKNISVSTFSKIEEGEKGSISFLSNPKYNKYLYNTQASVVVVNNSFQAEKKISCTLIRVKDAYVAFAQLLELYQKTKEAKKIGISSTSVIAKSAQLGKNVYIGDFVVIGENVQLGDGCKIYAHVSIGENTKLGNNCTLFDGARIYDDCIIGNYCTFHSGVIIGSDGFGFAPQDTQDFKKIAQIGNVIIEDYVEIGSNSTIDRATMGSTIIRKGVKLDNLIQVGHNVEIGKNTVIAAQSGISGSTKIGENCMFGGQVGISGHLTIGNRVMIAAQSGIASNIADDKIIQGSPAFDIAPYKRSYVYFKRLPDLIKRIDHLEKELKNK